jgi:hypothetical protein
MWYRLAALAATAALLTSCGLTTQAPTGGASGAHPVGGATVTATAAATVAASPSVPTAGPTAIASTGVPVAAGTLPTSCGGSPPSGSSSSTPLVALLSGQGAPYTVELVDLQGDVVNTTTVSSQGLPDPNDLPTVLGVGEAGVYLYAPSTGKLSLLGPTGSPQLLGQIPAGNQLDQFSVAGSPNGQCWILTDASFDSQEDATTRIYGGSGGGVPVLVATLPRGASEGGGYQVVGWATSGVLLGSDPTGIGGGPSPFGWTDGVSLSTVDELNPATGALSSPFCVKDGGSFRALAPDGTQACESQTASGARFDIQSLDGLMTPITTGVSQAGHVRFANGSSTVTYCTSDDQPTATAQFGETLWVAQLGGGAVSPRQLMSGDLSWCEQGAVTGPDSIVEVGGGGDPSSAVLVDLESGQVTPLAPADSIIGVI